MFSIYDYAYKAINKLLQTKPRKEADLCRSLSANMRGFVYYFISKIHMKKLKLLPYAIVLAMLVPFSASAALTTNLKYGSHGSAVTELQEFLISQGDMTGTATGNFYALTLAGVKAFQSKEGIAPVSGFWGPLSQSKASIILSPDLSVSNQDEQTQTGTVAPPVVTPAPVSDTGTQTQIQSLTSQLQTLTQQFQTQTKVQQQIQQNTQAIAQNTTPVVQSVPMDKSVYSIYADMDTIPEFTVQLGSTLIPTSRASTIPIIKTDWILNLSIYKGPVSIDDFKGSDVEPQNQPATIAGTITVTDNTDGTSQVVPIVYVGTAWGSNYTGQYIFTPKVAGDVSLTLTDSKDNVTKDIIIHVLPAKAQ